MHALLLTQRPKSGKERKKEPLKKWIGEHGVFWQKDFFHLGFTTASGARCCTIFRDDMDCRAFSGYAVSTFFRDSSFNIHLIVMIR
jgi:hypothetical protein